MTLNELVQSIGFEAQIPDIDALGGWAEIEAKNLFDSYTAQVKYEELMVPNAELQMNGPTIELPPNLQHIDKKSIRYLPEGEMDRSYILTSGHVPFGDNTGPTRYFHYRRNEFGIAWLDFWPNAEQAVGDKIIFDYWRFATEWPDGPDSRVFPEALIPVVKRELVAQASLLGGNKTFNQHKTLAKEAHTRSFGMTDVGSMNG